MAAVQPQTNAPAGKRGRAKKGEEAFQLKYIDAENKEHNRVVPGTKAIVAKDKAGKTVTVTMDGLPQAVKDQLAFAGFNRILFAPLKKDASNVIDTVTATVKQLSEGTLFAASEKKAGRVFDATLWVDSFARAMEIAVEKKVPNAKKVGEEAKKKMVAQLESATAQERAVRTKKWLTNPIFAYAKKEIEAARAKKSVVATGELAGLEF